MTPFITVVVLSLSTLQAQVTHGLDLEVSSVGEVKNKTGERDYLGRTSLLSLRTDMHAYFCFTNIFS